MTGAHLDRRTDDITPNQFDGSDSDRIAAAIARAHGTTDRVVIPARNANGTNVWLIDRAILLPSELTLVLDGCTIQLADDCIDNIIRTSNIGAGGAAAEWYRDIRIIGIGNATLRGAANPRSTGEGKRLSSDARFDSPQGRGTMSYGTDAGGDGVAQVGTWRNHGVVIAYVDGFELTNVTIERTHCWAVTHERVRNADLSRIRILNPPAITVDGTTHYVANRDGINLRQGCQHFRIDDVTGETGDDFIALTLLPSEPTDASGRLSGATATDPGYTPCDDDITDVRITNVACRTKNHGIALRTIGAARIRRVTVDGLAMQGNEAFDSHQSAVLFGGRGYGAPSPLGAISDVHVMNVVGDPPSALIHVEAAISNCTFMNGIYSGSGPYAVAYHDFDDDTPKYRISEGNRGRRHVEDVREVNIVSTRDREAPAEARA